MEKSADVKRIRAAVVQFDYQPTAFLNYSYIQEPALLGEGEQGITSLHLTVPGVEKQIENFREDVAKAYEEFTSERLYCILKRLIEIKVDLVVFPEYSIPANCLSLIDKSAGDIVVIAGSHTVTSRTLDTCTAVGINLTSDDVGRSICPVRISPNAWERIDKLTKSKWEIPSKFGATWKTLKIKVDDVDLTFAVFLCVDFINENDQTYQEIVSRDIWSKVDFGIVPSYSPVIRDFEQRARPVTERAGVPILYANVASVGGSRIYCHFRESDSFVELHSTRPLAAGDEAVIIVDILAGAQFEPKPTPLPIPQASQLVTVLPILHKETFQSFFNLNEKMFEAKGDTQKRSIAQTAQEELRSIAALSKVPQILRKKIDALLGAMDWRDGQWIQNCVNSIFTNTKEESLNEKRFVLLFRAQRLLVSILSHPQVQPNELNAVTEILNAYRLALDSLRHRIKPEILADFEPEDISVHTLTSDKPASSFTSVFLMRLQTASSHLEALEKQIRLIKTIAYEGNESIALNLRYTSLPNPTGNLKTISLEILGAAKATDRIDSRRKAEAFRRDFANLTRVTLQDAYEFSLTELDADDLARVTEPFPLKHIAELTREIEFGIQPYIDAASAPKIYHLEGNSSLARILDLLQSSPFACMISVHLHPIRLTDSEKAFFKTYKRSSNYRAEVGEGSMFYLGHPEINPALRLPDAMTMRRMLGDTEGLIPCVLCRFFITSDEPLSPLLLNTIGTELWANDSYQINYYTPNTENYENAVRAMRLAWADTVPSSKASEKLERVPFLFDPYEANRIFRLPLEGHSGTVATLFAPLRAPAAALPEEGIEIGLGFHSGAQKPIVVRLSDKERTKHTYIVGKTGTGKSTLLGRMIEQDINRGVGVCVIDPHGDLVNFILARIPEERKEDVVLFDPASTELPIGLNLLEIDPLFPNHKDFIVQETISIMRKLFYFEHSGPVFEHSIRHMTLTILDESMEGKGTLLEVPRLLTDTDFRKAVVPKLKDEFAKRFWAAYGTLGTSYISENLFYIVSKFDIFTTDRLMRNIIGQSKSSINLPEIVDNKKILLVKLPSAVIGEINAALLGMIIISKIRGAGMLRTQSDPSHRDDYYLYVDEFQNFAASGFETILAEARKFGIGLTVAHQHIGQLSAFTIATGRIEDRVAQAVFGNAGTMIVFRVGVKDAEMLAAELGKPVTTQNIENLKNYHAIVKTLFYGEVYPPFTIRTTLSPKAGEKELADTIKRTSLDKYGRPKEKVEQEIEERFIRWKI